MEQRITMERIDEVIVRAGDQLRFALGYLRVVASSHEVCVCVCVCVCV